MTTRLSLAAALLVIGITPARATELFGNIAVYNAAGTTLLGYVSKTYDGQNSFTYTATFGNALEFDIDSSASEPFGIGEPTPPLSSGNNYFTAVGGTGGYDMTPSNPGYAYLSSGSLTAAGGMPSAGATNDIEPLGYDAPSESAIWSHTGQILTPEWVNADSTASPDVVFYDPVVNYLGITADLSGYNAAYGDGASQVLLEFTTSFPSTTPEPSSGALGGIGLAAVGLTLIIKRRGAA